MIDEYHFDFFQDEGKFSRHARRKRRRCALVFLRASRTSETLSLSFVLVFLAVFFAFSFGGSILSINV